MAQGVLDPLISLVPSVVLVLWFFLEHPRGPGSQKCAPWRILADCRCGSLRFVIFISLGNRRAKCKKPMPAKPCYEFASKVQAATCIFACICVFLHCFFPFFQKCARRPRWEAHFCKTILSKVLSKMAGSSQFWVHRPLQSPSAVPYSARKNIVPVKVWGTSSI